MADIGAGKEEAFAKMERIALLNPRGWYTVEFHNPFLLLQGKVGNLKIQYTSIKHLYMLTESEKRTLVVLKINPPTQERETSYSHIVIQFESQRMIHNIRASSNSGTKYTGLVHEVFTTILGGFTKAQVTKVGKFQGYNDSYALKSYFEELYGLLYPLDRGFFFLPKPPTYIPHKEIGCVEFGKHEAGDYFDILIRLKSGDECNFRNIAIVEYENLFEFLSSKGLDLKKSQIEGGVPPVLHLESIENEASGDESDQEDPVYVIDNDEDDGGSPTDNSVGEDSDNNEEDIDFDEGAFDVIFGGEDTDASESGEENAKKPVKKRKRMVKDFSESLQRTSAFMFFSKSEIKKVAESNPGFTYAEVTMVVEERWKNLSAEAKRSYEAMARANATV